MDSGSLPIYLLFHPPIFRQNHYQEIVRLANVPAAGLTGYQQDTERLAMMQRKGKTFL